jgi:trans-2-enoyl-CoA reductase
LVCFFENRLHRKNSFQVGTILLLLKSTKAGLYAKSVNGDAFSDEIKKQTLALIKADLGQVDNNLQLLRCVSIRLQVFACTLC